MVPTPKGEPHRLYAWKDHSGLTYEIDHDDCTFDGFYVRCPLGSFYDWTGDGGFIDGPPEEPGEYVAQLYEDGEDTWIELTRGHGL